MPLVLLVRVEEGLRIQGNSDTTLSTVSLDARTLFTYAPNPVREVLSLNAQKDISIVYNILGQEVINKTPNAETSIVDISNLKSRTYFVKVIIDSAIDTIEVIKN